MFKEAYNQLKTAFILLVLLTVLTGLIYPLAVTALAQFFFPWEANGSLLKKGDINIGSLLIGQSFTSPEYFWGRPSATTPYPYNGESSSGSNSGPSNPAFLETVKARVDNLKKTTANTLIPIDLVTASGSGLDPDISLSAASYQALRVATARNIPEKNIQALIQSQINTRSFGVLGEPRINVLQLNIALDNLRIRYGRSTPQP